MDIHILLDGEQLGPFSETQVRKYLGEGLISPSDLASYEGAPDWQSLDRILAKLSPPDPEAEDDEALPVTPDVAPADAPPASSAAEIPFNMHNEAPETLEQPPPGLTAGPAAETEPPPPLTATQKTKRKLGKIVIQPILPLEPSPLDTAAPLARKKPKTGKTQLTMEPLRPTTALPPVASFAAREKKSARQGTGQLAFRGFSEKPSSPPTPVSNDASTMPEPSATPTAPAPLLPAKKKRAAAKASSRRMPLGLIIGGAALALFLIGLVVAVLYYFYAWQATPPANPVNAPPPVIQPQTQSPAPVPTAPTTASEYTARGVTRQSAGDLDGALADFTQAVALDPKNTDALYHRGVILAAKGDLNGALADYNQVLDLDSKYADAYSNRGFVKQAKGDLDGALADYSQALLLNPKISAAYYNQGLIQYQKGYFDAAIADYDHALAIDPKMAQAYYNRGNAKNAEGNLDGAIADYTQAVTLNPKLAAAYVKRGFARQTKNDTDGALDDYAQAITLNPNMAVAYYNRAVIKAQKGDLEGAIDDNTQAVTLDPKNGSPYYNRGMARFGTGDLAGAQTDLAKFCELMPRDAGTDNARIYLWLVSTQQDPQGDADAVLSREVLNDWNSPPEDLTSKIAAFLLGHIREGELIANAASPDPNLDPPQFCKIWYFTGMKRLLAGDMKTAISYFNKSLGTGQTSLCEYVFAQAELKALGQKDAASAQVQPSQ